MGCDERLELDAGVDELVQQGDRLVDVRGDLDDLRDRVHVRVGADRLDAERLRHLLRLGMEPVVVVVEARQGAGRVGVQLVPGVLGRRLRHDELVGHLLVVGHRVALLRAVGEHRLDVAVVQAVVLVVGQGDVLGGPVERRHVGGQRR